MDSSSSLYCTVTNRMLLVAASFSRVMVAPSGTSCLPSGPSLARFKHGARENAKAIAALLERPEVAKRHGHAVGRGAHRRREAHKQRVVSWVPHDTHGEAAHRPRREDHLGSAVVADVRHAQAIVTYLNSRSVQRRREAGTRWIDVNRYQKYISYVE